jgi:hypothetical protein
MDRRGDRSDVNPENYREDIVNRLKEIDDDELSLLDFAGGPELFKENGWDLTDFLDNVKSTFYAHVDLARVPDGNHPIDFSLTDIFAESIVDADVDVMMATFCLMTIHRTPEHMRSLLIELFMNLKQEHREDFLDQFIDGEYDYDYEEIPIPVRIFMATAGHSFDEKRRQKIIDQYGDELGKFVPESASPLDVSNDDDSNDNEDDDFPDFKYN